MFVRLETRPFVENALSEVMRFEGASGSDQDPLRPGESWRKGRARGRSFVLLRFGDDNHRSRSLIVEGRSSSLENEIKRGWIQLPAG